MLKVAFLGFGNLPKAFLSIVKERPLPEPLLITGVATLRHGCVVSSGGIAPDALLGSLRQNASLPGQPVATPKDVVERSEAEVILLCTPLNPKNAEPGLSLCKAALSQGKSVISVDKGPVAFALQELQALAKENGVSLRYEGTVMDGMPIFSLVESLLPGVRVLGFEGVLNSTTGIIMQSLEGGKAFEDGLLLAQRLGIAEADPTNDLDGFDSQVKACALANALLGAQLAPPLVSRQGLGRPTLEEVQGALAQGKVLRLVSRGQKNPDGSVEASVSPEWLSQASLLGATVGAASALVVKTDLMGEIGLYEKDPQIEQSAYALYLDLCLYLKTKRP